MPDLYLVCGSRDWPDESLWFVTQKMIELIPHGSIILTGGAPGVDRHAQKEAIRLKWTTWTMPANWNRYGRRAGMLRNLAMLDRNPVAVLAFQWGNSPGTDHTVSAARRRKIPVHLFTEADMRPDIGALDQDWEPINRGRAAAAADP